MKFLSARWEHLLLANYSIEPDVLRPFVPEGAKIDEFDGHVFVSLVAFLFNKMRVLGLPVPFHSCFEEVNLRFYVSPDKDPSIRAVTFIKEIVPKSAIPWIANNLFHENYVTLPMEHKNEPTQHWYSWDDGSKHSIAGKIGSELSYPVAGSIGEFITEHYWGYSKGPKSTLEYEVKHPQWKGCQIEDFQIDVDFASTYGEEFSFLNAQEPYNVLYAAGSAVEVSFPGRLKPKNEV